MENRPRGPYELQQPVTLADLRNQEARVRAVRDQLREAHMGSSLYFPFELSSKRSLRPTQFYMTKMPTSLVELFPALTSATQGAKRSVAARAGKAPAGAALGAPYNPADEEAATTEREPFAVDPNIVDRGRQGHARTQNALADYVRRRGFEPRSPQPDEPQFDLAWEEEGTVFVAEVKSITVRNEEQQLRLGLGQVLRYRQVLEKPDAETVAVLAVVRQPSDPEWSSLCEELGVVLTYPELLEQSR